MILTKTPLRVSFLGGGTDFPWFFETHGGAVISATISRYIYISALPSFDKKTTYLKYSQLEKVDTHKDILHPIFRSVLLDRQVPPYDWSVMADIPSGNGLASSSAFTVGLVNTVNRILRTSMTPRELALEAIRIEVDILNEPIGIQDQFASAMGGFNAFTFGKERKVESQSLLPREGTLPFRFVLVKVGESSRSASEFTLAQKNFIEEDRAAMKNLMALRDLTLEAVSKISEDSSNLAHFTRAGWELKKKTNPAATSEEIEETIQFSTRHGAHAGKLVGAGGSGFVFLLVDPPKTLELLEKLTRRGQSAFEVYLEEKGSNLVVH